VWLGASYTLGRPVPVWYTTPPAAQPHPHLCGSLIVGRVTGRQIRLWKRDCSACAWETGERRREVEVTEEMLAAERRRIGERDG
jgi:hypothetical protein